MAEQNIEGGITPRVGGEVAAHAGEEVLAADISLQLLEHRGALGVGNTVEVLLHGLDIAGIGGNGVGSRQLILLVSPGLFPVDEGDPGGIVFGFFRLRDGCGPGSKGLVEPQVIPPLHGHEVTEPHVGELVQDGIGAELVLVVRGL